MPLSATRPELWAAISAIAAAAALLAACTPPAQRLENRSRSPHDAGTRVAASIDFGRSETVSQQIEAFASQLTGAGSTVDLHLTILPAPAAPADYRVVYTLADGGQEIPVRCRGETGELVAQSYRFQFNPDYNHLLLTVRHGRPGEEVQARARCVTRRGGEPPAFVIEGQYRGEVEEIPTAHDVTLVAQPR